MTSDQTRHRMRAVVREWEASDGCREVFARRHGLTVSKLAYWTRRLRRDASMETPSVALAPVHVVTVSDRTDAGTIDLTLASGDRLTIHEGVSTDLLRTVLATLRPPC